MGNLNAEVETPEMRVEREFVFNPDNEFCCSECPYNIGAYDHRYPCGQQNCWVTCAQQYREEEE